MEEIIKIMTDSIKDIKMMLSWETEENHRDFIKSVIEERMDIFKRSLDVFKKCLEKSKQRDRDESMSDTHIDEKHKMWYHLCKVMEEEYDYLKKEYEVYKQK